MKTITAFFRLIRWPNLVFIVITQVLFNYAVVRPVFHQAALLPRLSNIHFLLLSLASVLIAAAGYIINDYFDVNIDRVNKPDKVLLDRYIRRRWAIFWHMLLSMVGVMLSLIVSFAVGDRFFIIGFANFGCVLALWVYSTTYKRRILVGNILISILTAWTVWVVYTAEALNWGNPLLLPELQAKAFAKLIRVASLYAGFAFIISLIREVIKDMEDTEGDRRGGCRTMPIIWGIPVSKTFTAVWLVVLVGVLLITQFYIVTFGWWLAVVYLLLAVTVPLLYIFRQLFRAHSRQEYGKLSSHLKIVMLTGILSMLFFLFYFKQ